MSECLTQSEWRENVAQRANEFTLSSSRGGGATYLNVNSDASALTGWLRWRTQNMKLITFSSLEEAWEAVERILE